MDRNNAKSGSVKLIVCICAVICTVVAIIFAVLAMFKNPDLKDIEEAGEYPVNWTVASNNENEIVVLFRSYTAAQIRYYINPVTGDTYVTEYVDGITEQEERTDENFNVRDYL